jgi:hypothetical protein
VSPARVKHLLTLTHLGPRVIRAALIGALPPRTTLDDLIDAGKHLDWAEQARRLALVAQP